MLLWQICKRLSKLKVLFLSQLQPVGTGAPLDSDVGEAEGVEIGGR